MAKKFNSVWPPPTYCALFADGSTMRMSFSTRLGKPIDYARGRRLCCSIRGREQAPSAPDDPGYFESVAYRRVLRHYAQRLVDSAVAELCGTPMPVKRRDYLFSPYDCYEENPIMATAVLGWGSIPLFRVPLPPAAAATDIVDGWVEKGDETYPDPHFAPQASAEIIELAPKRRARSDLEKALALLARLSEGERAILAERMVAA